MIIVSCLVVIVIVVQTKGMYRIQEKPVCLLVAKKKQEIQRSYFFRFSKDKKLTCGHNVSLNNSEMVSSIEITQLQIKPLLPNTKVLQIF